MTIFMAHCNNIRIFKIILRTAYYTKANKQEKKKYKLQTSKIIS